MASNPNVNKVVLADGRVLINLENDTVTAGDVLSGVSFHLPSGAISTGSCTFDADTSDADAGIAEILIGKTAYKNGQKLTGTMPNRGMQESEIEDADDEIVILNGYHDGSGKVILKSTEKAKLIPGNIKSGITILGVEGNYSGESVTAGSVSVTPTFSQQTILPSSISKDYISQIDVAAISVVETDNIAGGKTVTIGTAAS